MPRISVFNMLVGFLALLLAMCGGVFVAYDADKAFLYNKDLLMTWQYTLQKSAHGHLSLFGYCHILFGLTLPYSIISPRFKIWQTIGISLGSLAMSLLLVTRAWVGVAPLQEDYLGIAIGSCLVCAMLALLAHTYGLMLKLMR